MHLYEKCLHLLVFMFCAFKFDPVNLIFQFGTVSFLKITVWTLNMEKTYE